MKGVILALAFPLAAQDLYLAPGEFVVSPGQRISVVVEGAALARLRDAALYSAKGVYNVVNLRSEGNTVIGDATAPARGSLVLAVRTVPETVSRERRSSYAKALLLSDAGDEFFRRAAGLAFEFVPEANPYRLRPGARLPVRLLLGGEPAADAPVEASQGGEAHAAGRTDSAGRIAIPIAAAGTWRLRATLRRRSPDPGADWETFTTTLVFAVGEGEAQ